MQRRPTLTDILAAVAAAALVWRPSTGRHAEGRKTARHRRAGEPQPDEAVHADA